MSSTALFKKDNDSFSNIKKITRSSLSLCINRAFSSSLSISLTLSSTSLPWMFKGPWKVLEIKLRPFSNSSTQALADLQKKIKKKYVKRILFLRDTLIVSKKLGGVKRTTFYSLAAKSSFFSDKWPIWGLLLGTQITTQGWLFIIIKNSHQDLSNEGSNFILRSQEVGHWVAQI